MNRELSVSKDLLFEILGGPNHLFSNDGYIRGEMIIDRRGKVVRQVVKIYTNCFGRTITKFKPVNVTFYTRKQFDKHLNVLDFLKKKSPGCTEKYYRKKTFNISQMCDYVIGRIKNKVGPEFHIEKFGHFYEDSKHYNLTFIRVYYYVVGKEKVLVSDSIENNALILYLVHKLGYNFLTICMEETDREIAVKKAEELVLRYKDFLNKKLS